MAVKRMIINSPLFWVTLISISNGAIGNDESSTSPSRGFGDDIDWVSWDIALTQAQEHKKPVFLLIHKSWCGACKALKSEFEGSKKRKDFVKLSKEFVMVNTEDDEEPTDEKYAPDGGYIPRILLLDENGEVLEGTTNSNYPSNKYYFPHMPTLIDTMKKALKTYGKLSNDGTDQKEKTKKKKNTADEDTADDNKKGNKKEKKGNSGKKVDKSEL